MAKTPRKYKPLDYATVLQLIKQGEMLVNLCTTVVTFRGRVLVPFTDRRRRYLFVRIYYRGARRAVSVHRLVWMKHHGRVVPPGFDIHHRDANPRNNRYTNLQKLALGKHRSEAGKIRYEYPPDWDEIRDEEAEMEYFSECAVA